MQQLLCFPKNLWLVETIVCYYLGVLMLQHLYFTGHGSELFPCIYWWCRLRFYWQSNISPFRAKHIQRKPSGNCLFLLSWCTSVVISCNITQLLFKEKKQKKKRERERKRGKQNFLIFVNFLVSSISKMIMRGMTIMLCCFDLKYSRNPSCIGAYSRLLPKLPAIGFLLLLFLILLTLLL